MPENNSTSVLINLDTGIPYRFNNRIMSGDDPTPKEMTGAGLGFPLYDFFKSNLRHQEIDEIKVVSGRSTGTGISYREEFSLSTVDTQNPVRINLGNGRSEFIKPDSDSVGIYQVIGKNIPNKPQGDLMAFEENNLSEFSLTYADIISEYLPGISKIGIQVKTDKKQLYAEFNV
ncbi:MAG: hypothetical protein GOU98_04465 [Candidatus Altiarchaeota archaeon]|nr:hypothetical protein [Candidatus Altiarchaeota archaeon]